MTTLTLDSPDDNSPDPRSSDDAAVTTPTVAALTTAEKPAQAPAAGLVPLWRGAPSPADLDAIRAQVQAAEDRAQAPLELQLDRLVLAPGPELAYPEAPRGTCRSCGGPATNARSVFCLRCALSSQHRWEAVHKQENLLHEQIETARARARTEVLLALPRAEHRFLYKQGCLDAIAAAQKEEEVSGRRLQQAGAADPDLSHLSEEYRRAFKAYGDARRRLQAAQYFFQDVIHAWCIRLDYERVQRVAAYPVPPRRCSACYSALPEGYEPVDEKVVEAIETICSPQCVRALGSGLGIDWGVLCRWCGVWYDSPVDLPACSPFCLFALPFDLEEHGALLRAWPVVSYLPPPPLTMTQRRRQPKVVQVQWREHLARALGSEPLPSWATGVLEPILQRALPESKMTLAAASTRGPRPSRRLGARAAQAGFDGVERVEEGQTAATREELVSALRTVVANAGAPFKFTPTQLLAEVRNRLGSTAINSTRELAVLLGPLGLVSSSVRINGKVVRGYVLDPARLADLQDG